MSKSGLFATTLLRGLGGFVGHNLYSGVRHVVMESFFVIPHCLVLFRVLDIVSSREHRQMWRPVLAPNSAELLLHCVGRGVRSEKTCSWTVGLCEVL